MFSHLASSSDSCSSSVVFVVIFHLLRKTSSPSLYLVSSSTIEIASYARNPGGSLPCIRFLFLACDSVIVLDVFVQGGFLRLLAWCGTS